MIATQDAVEQTIHMRALVGIEVGYGNRRKNPRVRPDVRLRFINHEGTTLFESNQDVEVDPK